MDGDLILNIPLSCSQTVRFLQIPNVVCSKAGAMLCDPDTSEWHMEKDYMPSTMLHCKLQGGPSNITSLP